MKYFSMFEGKRVYYDHKGYALAWIDGRDTKIHVWVWERKYGPIPDGYVVHHKNHDKGDFRLSNLEILSHSDHQRVHAGWIREDGEWITKPCTDCGLTLPLDNFYSRGVGRTPSAKCRPCHRTACRKYNKRYYRKNKTRILRYCQQRYEERKNAVSKSF